MFKAMHLWFKRDVLVNEKFKPLQVFGRDISGIILVILWDAIGGFLGPRHTILFRRAKPILRITPFC